MEILFLPVHICIATYIKKSKFCRLHCYHYVGDMLTKTKKLEVLSLQHNHHLIWFKALQSRDNAYP